MRWIGSRFIRFHRGVTNYYTPVGSSVNGNPAYVYLYNPSTNNLNIQVTTKLGVSTVTVPGTNGVYQYTMPSSSGASFIATNGRNFYAICTVNALPSSDTAYNWGFSLVPTIVLTTEEDVGWAPGSSDGTVDGSPVWVTALNPPCFMWFMATARTASPIRPDTNTAPTLTFRPISR